MGSPARLLALAYWPALVTVVTGIYTPSVPGSEIDRTPNRTAFFRHGSLRVRPSLLSQSDSAYCTSSRLEHRYAASLCSVYNPSSLRLKIRSASTYRFTAAATKRLSNFRPLFFNASAMSDELSGLAASRRISAISEGTLPGFKPVALRRRFGRRPSAPFSKSLNLCLNSANSRSRLEMASSRARLRNSSLILSPYRIALSHDSQTRSFRCALRCVIGSMIRSHEAKSSDFCALYAEGKYREANGNRLVLK